MNKHNIVELFEYKQDKGKVNFEQECYRMLDKTIQSIHESQVYIKNLKNYLEATTRSGKTTQEFSSNLINQMELMFMESWSAINKKGD